MFYLLPPSRLRTEELRSISLSLPSPGVYSCDSLGSGLSFAGGVCASKGWAVVAWAVVADDVGFMWISWWTDTVKARATGSQAAAYGRLWSLKGCRGFVKRVVFSLFSCMRDFAEDISRLWTTFLRRGGHDMEVYAMEV